MSITPEEQKLISSVVLDLCGIALDESKAYLIESRFKKLFDEFDISSFSELARTVRTGHDKKLKNAFINAITTRETHFFRDTTPFEALAHKAIPELIDSKADSLFPNRIRIWSAACSSGQEVYSIAMTLHEVLPNIDDWNISILGTDISDAAVEAASRGRYSKFDIERGTSPEQLNRYFTEDGNYWKVNDELRSLVTFEKRNLLEPFTGLGPFDIIFCRNVAIYFDLPTKRDLFERLTKVLSPQGYLFVGSAESLASFGDRFKPQRHCQSVFYQPNYVNRPAYV